MSQPRPTKEGNLKKYRNFLLGWCRRHFKLERSYFHYFEAPHSPQPIGSITRGDISDVKESVQFEGKQNVFELHTKSGIVWFLQADSAEEMVSWMKVLMPGKEFQDKSQEQTTPSGFVVLPNSSPQPPYQYNQSPGNYQPQWHSPHQTSPVQGTPPPFDPNMFAAGGPLYDPRVHAQVPYTPPPPYTEENQAAQPLPSKTGL